MRGRRVESVKAVLAGEPGDYTLTPERDALWAKLPTGSLAHLLVTTGASHDNPPTWNMVEHEDGTITLDPSIEQHSIEGHVGAWHGFLERGVWREV